MASIMPPIPRIFFLYVEPLMLTYSALLPFLEPQSTTALLPGTLSSEPSGLVLHWSLQHSSLLVFIVLVNTIIMLYSTEPTVIRLYVLAMAFADVPHWAAVAYVMDREGLLWHWRLWTTEMKVQMFAPCATLAIKVAYLAGWLGRDRLPREGTTGRLQAGVVQGRKGY